ncbi:hypothetical protein [Mammaliicoccus fleurettii]|uniref:hypothetical protein n=1 Tax=Mammaliicoccus fleurettii TaxID=150056 RepID=UPI002DB6C6C4|nr:hypothetical protein [Mammaliicoccus fleurettii]MEB8067498.1 hypothetical protein [Mammaliicoccus fleurettii]
MLTKEFSAKVGLSEKQVRKIVQHLEDRGYQLSKTEYRGREATDFQEEDIELFQEIAEKVKETNSYDQAFETLEQEKDFLQVLVKDEPANQTPELQHLIEELRLEVQHMRRERQMLGEMLQQVHIQQQKLEQTLALQAPEQTSQATETKVGASTTEKANSAEEITADKATKETVDSKEDTKLNEDTPNTELKEQEKPTVAKSEDKASAVKTEPTTTSDKKDVEKEEVKVENKEVTADKNQTTNDIAKKDITNKDVPKENKAESPVTQDTVIKEAANDATKEEKEETTSSQVVTNLENNEQTDEEPKKKGFFQRLFNI